jgi:transitional endoplasmic reticulum ATPase
MTLEWTLRPAGRRGVRRALGSQQALDASLKGSGREGPVTEDYLLAVAGTRATVSPEVAADFQEGIVTLARLQGLVA